VTTHAPTDDSLRPEFGLPDDVAYLNCAAMAPLHDAVVAAGRGALEKQRRPFEREMAEFFDPVRELRRAFARLIHIEDDERIAMIPAASYGLANAARQIRPAAGSNVVIAAGQFHGTGLAYYGPSFDDGIPIEENWLTHEGCEDVATFVDPNPRLRPKALRYSVGEHPSFVPLAMMRAALDVVLGWPPDRIAAHTTRLLAPFVPELERMGLLRDPQDHRAPHLFGLTLPDRADPQTIAARLKAANVIVSVRGGAIRVSLHLFNDHTDVERLVRQLTEMLR